jgi:hypothetical protein
VRKKELLGRQNNLQSQKKTSVNVNKTRKSFLGEVLQVGQYMVISHFIITEVALFKELKDSIS